MSLIGLRTACVQSGHSNRCRNLDLHSSRSRAPLNRKAFQVLRAQEDDGAVNDEVVKSGDMEQVPGSDDGQSIVEDMRSSDFKYTGPEPKRFTIGEGQLLDIIFSSIPFFLRLGTGVFVQGYKARLGKTEDGVYTTGGVAGQSIYESSAVIETFKRPKEPLILYEYEPCPFCKTVREAISILDLDVMIRPCPKGGPNFRPKATELGGRRVFPFIVDPNTGKSMYESDDIVKYLFEEYGDGEVPLAFRLGILTAITCSFSSIPRFLKGFKYRTSKMPGKPLVYWGYETSPFCKVVREVMTELELPHLSKSTARGSAKRQELLGQAGHFQVPYLQDPNTGVAIFESKAIIEYLEETYAA